MSGSGRTERLVKVALKLSALLAQTDAVGRRSSAARMTRSARAAGVGRLLPSSLRPHVAGQEQALRAAGRIAESSRRWPKRLMWWQRGLRAAGEEVLCATVGMAGWVRGAKAVAWICGALWRSLRRRRTKG